MKNYTDLNTYITLTCEIQKLEQKIAKEDNTRERVNLLTKLVILQEKSRALAIKNNSFAAL